MTATEPDPTEPTHTVHRAAVDALTHGLCPVQAATDGTKKPAHQWKRYQAAPPTRAQIDQWFADGHPGYGIICGAVSGHLEMLELEGRAVVAGLGDKFADACDTAGIGPLLDRILDGYLEQTPGDGLHTLLRVTDGPAKGNLKLARDIAGDVLIETRGEGGFVILAPSHGTTHPSGRPWGMINGGFATIANVTTAERDALYAVANTFDQAPQATPITPPGQPLNLRPIAADGESWIAALCRDLAAKSWGEILGRYSIAHHHDAGDVTYWTRPGKDTADGWSATTNAKGTDRLIVFSSSMPLEPWSGNGPAPSYDRLDVIAAYEYHGDRMAAARDLAGRNTPPPRQNTTSTPPPGVDPETGEIARPGINLPDTFWNARPNLAHIRQAAHSRGRSADAVLVFVLARIAATVHPSIQIPPIVGSNASLNFLGAVIATSGAGKSTAKDVAMELVPIDRTDVIDDVPMGSGEGLIELFFEWVGEEDAEGKTRKVKRQTKSAAFVYLDEGQALAEMGNRKGATLMPTLRSAWSGGVIGQSNASQETHRVLKAHTYRLSVMVGFQMEYAAGLMDDGGGGTPQRFIFAAATDPTVPRKRSVWPGELRYPLPTVFGAQTVMDVADAIMDEVWDRSVGVTRTEVTLEALDSHRDLVKLKVAGLLAVLDGRMNIDADDWDLAEEVVATSARVRQWVIDTHHMNARDKEQWRTRQAVATEMARLDTTEERAKVAGAKAIARAAQRAGGVIDRRTAHNATASKHRAIVPFPDMLDHALQQGWITTEGDGWKAGKV